MATAASSYYSEADQDRPLAQNAQVDRSGSYPAGNQTVKSGLSRSGVQSAGSSVDFEPSNETEEHHIRKGLMPTSQGPPQVHPVKNSSHIPEGETHTGLVGTDGRPLSNVHSGQHHQQGDRELSGLGQQQGGQYTARDEGLEPYSAPDTGNHGATGNYGPSGYLPEKKIGPAAGAAEHSDHHDNTNTGLTGHHDNSNSTNTGLTGTNEDSSNNKQSILADPTHPDNVLVEELERRAQKSGTHAVGFGTHGDEEPPHALEHGYDPNPAHILNSDNEEGNHHGGALAAGGLGAAGLGAGGYSRNTRGSFDNEGDHTDNEAPDMQPSQSYIQRQSLYSQPASTRHGHGDNNDLPLEQQKTGQSYGQQAPFSSRDYGQGHQGHLVPAGGGVIRPVAGVLPEDAEGGLLAGNYEPSHYTQAGMAGVGAGSAAALGAGALATRSSGASAVGTGALNDGEYAQHAYDNQQGQQHLQPQAQNMEAYPSQQTQRTQQTQQSYGTAPAIHQEQSRDLQDEQQSSRHVQGVQDDQPQHHQQYIAAAPVPVPQPIFSTHHQQGESRLQEELPGQQEQSFQQQLFQQHQEQPFQQQQEQPFQQQNQQMNGPTTAVPVIATVPKAQSTRESQLRSPSSTTAATPIAGGGLAAAIATSGHQPTKDDKKSLKKEIKSERKFEKSLQEEAKKEAEEIEIAMKMGKLSLKKADKSGRYEANFRSTYEKAIKKEIAAKQRLLKVTNEYNKVAADLERTNKEMEIRRNAHLADIQTRDSDSNKVDELRRVKGQHDMEREARHGDSLTKQKQAKRALSMSSKRKSSLL